MMSSNLRMIIFAPNQTLSELKIKTKRVNEKLKRSRVEENDPSQTIAS